MRQIEEKDELRHQIARFHDKQCDNQLLRGPHPDMKCENK